MYRFASYISLPAINMAEVGNFLEHYQEPRWQQAGSRSSWVAFFIYWGCIEPGVNYGTRDHALHFCLNYGSADGYGNYLTLQKFAERWRKWQKYTEPNYKMVNDCSLSWCTAPSYLRSTTQIFLTVRTVFDIIMYDPQSYHVLLPV